MSNVFDPCRFSFDFESFVVAGLTTSFVVANVCKLDLAKTNDESVQFSLDKFWKLAPNYLQYESNLNESRYLARATKRSWKDERSRRPRHDATAADCSQEDASKASC